MWKSLEQIYRIPKPIPYSEIPIMVSQGGKLVCIPINRDMPSIGVVGIKRSGKSYCLHGLIDRIYHKRNDAMIILNDPHNESLTYSLKSYCIINKKMYGEKFEKQLESIGLRPMRLPVVHCYPAISTEALVDVPKNVAQVLISLRAEKLFDSEELFGDLGKSGKYFRMVKEKLMKCKSYEEMLEVIDSEIPDNEGMRLVKNKLKIMINNLFQEKIISFDDDIVSKSFIINNDTGEKFELHILQALMFARCVPALMTNTIFNKPWFPSYLKVVIEDLFENQKKGLFYKKQINSWVFIDELIGIDSTKRKPTATTTILQRLVTEGGPARIGTIWASQIYTEVRDGIRKNSKYLISFRLNSSTEVNSIMNDFDLTESQANSIKNLKKEYFECVAVTSDEHFILYDLATGERSKYSGYVRGYAIPPLSLHKPPEFVMPQANMKYALHLLKEKRISIGNAKTNAVIVGSKEEDRPSTMKYEELGETAFIPENFDMALFAPKTVEIISISYDELKTYGYEIFSYVVQGSRIFRQQRVTYGLKKIYERISPFSTIMTYLPKDVIVEMNPFERKVRLRSPNIASGMTSWRNIDA